jgi:hypothetical protein
MTLKQAFEKRAREETIKEMQPLIFQAEEKAREAEQKAKYLSENLEKTTMTLKQAFEKKAREETIKEMQPLIFQAEQQVKQAEHQAKQTEQQTKYKIAISLLKKGLGLEMISETTQLSLQKLQSLQEELAT